jgi:hypothetical protein
LASDVTSLQSIEGEPAVPRRTCSRGVSVIPGLGGEEFLSKVLSSPARCRCGSLVVPRTLLGLAGCPADPRGSRPRAVLVAHHLAVTDDRVRAPVVFAPLQSFADSPRSDNRPSSHGIRPVRRALQTSLSSSCVVRPHRPFIDMLRGVHSRHDVATAPSAPGQPDQESRSDLVVSHHLAGFLRRPLREERSPSQVRRVAGLLHPAANRGVHRVSDPRVLLPGRSSLPRDGSYPSKDSTRPQPYRVTTAHCLLDVHSPRCSRLQGSRCRIRLSARLPPRARLQGFALRMSPYHRPPFPTPDGLPSRGLF